MNKIYKFVLPALIAAFCSSSLAACASTLVKPSNMVNVRAVVSPGETQTFRGGTPQGTGAGEYTVPDGKVFVITRVIIQSMSPGAGTLDLTFMQSDTALGDRIRETWRVPNSQPTEYDFTPGTLISGGSQLKAKNTSSVSGDVSVALYGYITSPN